MRWKDLFSNAPLLGAVCVWWMVVLALYQDMGYMTWSVGDY